MRVVFKGTTGPEGDTIREYNDGTVLVYWGTDRVPQQTKEIALKLEKAPALTEAVDG